LYVPAGLEPWSRWLTQRLAPGAVDQPWARHDLMAAVVILEGLVAEQRRDRGLAA
jgi:hypothetical protein